MVSVVLDEGLCLALCRGCNIPPLIVLPQLTPRAAVVPDRL